MLPILVVTLTQSDSKKISKILDLYQQNHKFKSLPPLFHAFLHFSRHQTLGCDCEKYDIIYKLTQKDSFLFTSELAHLQFQLRNVLKERYHRMQRKEEALFQPDSCSLDMQLRKLTLSININCCPSILITVHQY